MGLITQLLVKFRIPSITPKFLIFIDCKIFRPYPFQSDFFDFIFSNQVLEHVETISFLFSELSRVLHPHGVSLHLYPRKRMFVEPHCHIPFVHLIPSRSIQSFVVFSLYDLFNFNRPLFSFSSSQRLEFSQYISTQLSTVPFFFSRSYLTSFRAHGLFSSY